jgi:hypothetical protein
MSKLEIKKCVLEIIDSLCDRNGFDDWWYNLDDDIEKEITTELESIIERRLNKDEFNIDDIFTSHMIPPHLFGLKEDDGVGKKSLEIIKQNKTKMSKETKKVRVQLLDEQDNVIVSSTVNEDSLITIKDLHGVDALNDIYQMLKEELKNNKDEKDN